MMLHELKCLPDLSNISHMKINVNKQSFDGLLNALNAVCFEIGALKGIDVNTGVNVQKYVMQRNLYGSGMNSKGGVNVSNSNSGSNVNMGQGSGGRNRVGGSFVGRKNFGE